MTMQATSSPNQTATALREEHDARECAGGALETSGKYAVFFHNRKFIIPQLLGVPFSLLCPEERYCGTACSSTQALKSQSRCDAMFLFRIQKAHLL
jgi:hypothetical protein